MNTPSFPPTARPGIAGVLRCAAVALLVGLVPCHGAAAKKRIVTTFTIIQDMAQNVAGEAATVESITKPGAEIHGYEPTPQDIVKAQKADLVLWNGMNLERWFEKFFDNVRDVPSAILTAGTAVMRSNDLAATSPPRSASEARAAAAHIAAMPAFMSVEPRP